MTPWRAGTAARRRAVLLAACVLPLTACNPHQYDEVPAVHDARPTELPGTWLGYDHTTVTLTPDGKATISLLDGQEFDFDEGWRVSGTGTWKLTTHRTGWNDGQHVKLTLTTRTESTTRPEPTPRTSPAPSTYTWTFELRRTEKKALQLYFFFGDPDSRSTYVLERQGTDA
ncbi:hypothetical protein [Streptomyces griseosporeus]